MFSVEFAQPPDEFQAQAEQDDDRDQEDHPDIDPPLEFDSEKAAGHFLCEL